MRAFFILLVCMMAGLDGFSQLFPGTVKDLQDYQYKKEISFGARLQTNGVSLFGEGGWIKDLKRTRLLQVEYTYYVDFAQKKQPASAPGGRDYLYGVENRLNLLHFSYGIKRTIAEKADHNGVRLSFVGFGGVALAILKPYYLNVYADSSANTKPTRYSSPADSVFLNKSRIAEASPPHYGLNQIQLVPGLHGQAALDFDWGLKDEFVKALEAGIMLDLYYKPLPLLVNNNNHFYQVALFISFQFGKRW